MCNIAEYHERLGIINNKLNAATDTIGHRATVPYRRPRGSIVKVFASTPLYTVYTHTHTHKYFPENIWVIRWTTDAQGSGGYGASKISPNKKTTLHIQTFTIHYIFSNTFHECTAQVPMTERYGTLLSCHFTRIELNFPSSGKIFAGKSCEQLEQTGNTSVS